MNKIATVLIAALVATQTSAQNLGIKGCTNPKHFALTFDDGPSPLHTDKLLGYLAAKNVKATFFVVGNMVDGAPAVLDRTYKAGHMIAGHSMTHPDFVTLTRAQIEQEMRSTDAAVQRAIGVTPIFFRYPYGSANALANEVVNGFGKTAIHWNADTKDYELQATNPAQILTDAQRLVTALNNQEGPILLQHDIWLNSIEQVPAIIDWGLSQGFQFVTIAECIGADAAYLRPDGTKILLNANNGNNGNNGNTVVPVTTTTTAPVKTQAPVTTPSSTVAPAATATNHPHDKTVHNKNKADTSNNNNNYSNNNNSGDASAGNANNGGAGQGAESTGTGSGRNGASTTSTPTPTPTPTPIPVDDPVVNGAVKFSSAILAVFLPIASYLML